MDDQHPSTERRTQLLQWLYYEKLTPLLQSEMRVITSLYENSKSSTDTSPDHSTIDMLLDELESHWFRIYGSMRIRACIFEDTALYQLFLSNQLLQDYANTPFKVSAWAQVRAGMLKNRQQNGGKGSEAQYQLHVCRPINELMLDVQDVESKLLWAAQGADSDALLHSTSATASSSYTQHLIAAEDWTELGTALARDRSLAKRLYQEQPLHAGAYDDRKAARVFRGIEEMECKYAREIAEARASNHVTDSDSIPLLTSALDHADRGLDHGQSPKGWASNVYKIMTGGSGDMSLRSRARK